MKITTGTVLRAILCVVFLALLSQCFGCQGSAWSQGNGGATWGGMPGLGYIQGAGGDWMNGGSVFVSQSPSWKPTRPLIGEPANHDTDTIVDLGGWFSW